MQKPTPKNFSRGNLKSRIVVFWRSSVEPWVQIHTSKTPRVVLKGVSHSTKIEKFSEFQPNLKKSVNFWILPHRSEAEAVAPHLPT